MASDNNYKSQMSQVFSDLIERVKKKMELFAERKKIDRSDSAPAPDISVTRSAPLRSRHFCDALRSTPLQTFL